MQAFSRINWVNYFLAICFGLGHFVFRALSWRVLLLRQIDFRKTFLTMQTGYLINNILPLRLGEIGRALLLSQSTDLQLPFILSTIILERLLDLAIVAVLLIITLPLVLGKVYTYHIAVLFLVILVIGLLILFVIVRHRDWITAHLYATTETRKKGGIRNFILPKVISLLEGLTVLTQPTQFLLSIFYLVLAWLQAILASYVLLLTIAPHAPFWWGVFVNAAPAIGTALPSAPGGLGVFEATIVAALSLLKVSFSTAVAYAVVMHFNVYLITTIFGVVALGTQRYSLSRLIADINHRGYRTPWGKT